MLGFKRRITLAAPDTSGYRGTVTGSLSRTLEPGEKVNLFLMARDGNWYLQREISFWQDKFFVNCYFGVPDAPTGAAYIIQAVVGRGIYDPAASKDLVVMTHHQFHKFKRKLRHFNTSEPTVTTRA